MYTFHQWCSSSIRCDACPLVATLALCSVSQHDIMLLDPLRAFDLLPFPIEYFSSRRQQDTSGSLAYACIYLDNAMKVVYDLNADYITLACVYPPQSPPSQQLLNRVVIAQPAYCVHVCAVLRYVVVQYQTVSEFHHSIHHPPYPTLLASV